MADVEPPAEPPPTRWRLPNPRTFDDESASHDLVALGGDLEPGTLLAAYRLGLFPMYVRTPAELKAKASDEQEPSEERIGWWSPDPRGVLELGQLAVSRSLRQSIRRYRCTINQAFDLVLEGCADRGRAGGWINEDIAAAYRRLHRLGWAHSVEVWDRRAGGEPDAGALVGGLYGVAIGGLFAGESMFHQVRDASKVALVHLVAAMKGSGATQARLLDVQWLTEHLASLGADEVSRSDYLQRLDEALHLPVPKPFLTSHLPEPPRHDPPH